MPTTQLHPWIEETRRREAIRIWQREEGRHPYYQPCKITGVEMTEEEGGGDVVTIDDEAAAIINSMLDDRGFDPESAGMRISTEQGGCAGRLYRFNLTDGPHADDIICGTDTANLFVDAASREHLDGAELSLADTAHGTGFRIENPNADQQCGCGLSFR